MSNGKTLVERPVVRGSIYFLTALVLTLTVASSALAKPKGGIEGRITCDCTCSGGTVSEGRTYSAPYGDPQKCESLNGTTCSKDVPPRQLEDCTGNATKTGGGMPPNKPPPPDSPGNKPTTR
jgi:hypothetical protein